MYMGKGISKGCRGQPGAAESRGEMALSRLWGADGREMQRQRRLV